MKMMLTYVALVVVVVGFVNFIWFVTESQSLGGDALNGYRADDRCFVGSHGSFKQVDCQTWEQSRLHGISIFVTHPLALISFAYLLLTAAFPNFVGKMNSQEAQRRLGSIRASGPALASGRYGGRLGFVNFSGPLLGITVYPGGLVVSPIFMAPMPIEKAEIRRLERRKQLFGRAAIQMSYSTENMASPLLLYASSDSDVARAIEHMAGMSFT